jgi:hypothetical protein
MDKPPCTEAWVHDNARRELVFPLRCHTSSLSNVSDVRGRASGRRDCAGNHPRATKSALPSSAKSRGLGWENARPEPESGHDHESIHDGPGDHANHDENRQSVGLVVLVRVTWPLPYTQDRILSTEKFTGKVNHSSAGDTLRRADSRALEWLVPAL